MRQQALPDPGNQRPGLYAPRMSGTVAARQKEGFV
jgi:hypothetical protein